MDDTRAGNIPSVACNWGANSAQGVGGILTKGSVDVIEGERLHQRVQAVGGPLPHTSTNQKADSFLQPGVNGEASHVWRPEYRPQARDDSQDDRLV